MKREWRSLPSGHFQFGQLVPTACIQANGLACDVTTRQCASLSVCQTVNEGATCITAIPPEPHGNSSQSVIVIFEAIEELHGCQGYHHTKNKYLLPHVSAEHVFDVADTLMEEELIYAVLMDKLNQHFPPPQRNMEYEMFVFHQAAQECSENLHK